MSLVYSFVLITKPENKHKHAGNVNESLDNAMNIEGTKILAKVK